MHVSFSAGCTLKSDKREFRVDVDDDDTEQEEDDEAAAEKEAAEQKEVSEQRRDFLSFSPPLSRAPSCRLSQGRCSAADSEREILLCAVCNDAAG